jgi:hypothetical protein
MHLLESSSWRIREGYVEERVKRWYRKQKERKKETIK